MCEKGYCSLDGTQIHNLSRRQPSLGKVLSHTSQINFRYIEYVIFDEGWIGGYVMGVLWTRLVISLPPLDPNGGPNAAKVSTTLAQVSPYADTLAAFSTISQEVRHESQPSWIFEEETVRGMWIRAHTLLLQALKIHPSFPRIEKFLTLEQFLLHLGTPNPPIKLLVDWRDV